MRTADANAQRLEGKDFSKQTGGSGWTSLGLLRDSDRAGLLLSPKNDDRLSVLRMGQGLLSRGVPS